MKSLFDAMHAGAIYTLLFLQPALIAPASAFDLDLGNGNQIHVRRGPFGHHTWELTDGMGDQIAGTHSAFGDRQTEVHVLGNDVSVHKGLFGDKAYTVDTMHGESVAGQKQFAGGPHRTAVDLSGNHAAAEHFYGDNQRPAAGGTWQNTGPQTSLPQGDKSAEIVNPNAASRNITERDKEAKSEKVLP